MKRDKATLEAFGQVLRDTMSVYDRSVSEDALRVWWAALENYSLEQIRGGLTRHLRDPERGRFPPKPADVVAGVQGAYLEQWEAPEVAWKTAVTAADQTETIVWPSEEAREAWHAAGEYPYKSGDDIGARMSFERAYRRLMQAAADRGERPKPIVSPGHDPEKRNQALKAAEERGLLPPAEVQRHMLPDRTITPEGRALMQLSGPAPDRGDTLERLRQIKRQIRGQPEAVDRTESREAERKRQAALVERSRGQEG